MLTSKQKKTVLGLSLSLALRILGLSLVLPIFIFYGSEFTNNPALIGFAFGGYGLTQAIFQVPFGILSDKFGRKKTIVLGLLLFAIGSIIAAFPPNIFVLIFARLLQGCGAISSSVIAFVADVVPDEDRSKAMAYIGMPYGIAFSIGIVSGPLLSAIFGYPFLFELMAVLTIITAICIHMFIPEPKKTKKEQITKISTKDVGRVAKNRNLVKLSISGFINNFILVSMFSILPWFIVEFIMFKGWTDENLILGRVMLTVVIVGIVIMFLATSYADRGHRRQMGIIGFGILASSPALLMVVYKYFLPSSIDTTPGGTIILIILAATLFFSGFSIIEPMLQSIVTRVTDRHITGTAAGFYSMSQFIGTFTAGVSAGLVILTGVENLLLLIIIFAIIGLITMVSLDYDG
jgi:MFS family permease